MLTSPEPDLPIQAGSCRFLSREATFCRVTCLLILALPGRDLLVQAEEYKFASLFNNPETVFVDSAGMNSTLGPTTAGEVRTFPFPTVLLGAHNGGNGVREWANLRLAGTEFADRPFRRNPATYTVLAVEEDATVTFWIDGELQATRVVAAGSVGTEDLVAVGKEVEIFSTANVLVAVNSVGVDFMLLSPATTAVFGTCSRECDICIVGGNASIPIERTCTNGTVEQVTARHFSEDAASYYHRGPSCRWSAPDGYKISGRVSSDGTGGGGTSLVAAENFQLVTAIPTFMNWVKLVSAEPTTCTDSAKGSFSLDGSLGVFHARLENVEPGTILSCDRPVTALGDVQCPSFFTNVCEGKETNLIAPPLYMNTTTSTTSTTFTQTSTSSMTTATVSSITSTLSTMTATSITTSVSTSTTTNSATTSTTSTNTFSTTETATSSSTTSATHTTTATSVTASTCTSSTTTVTSPSTTTATTNTTTSSSSGTETLTTVTTTVTELTTTWTRTSMTSTMSTTPTATTRTDTTLTFTETTLTFTASTFTLTSATLSSTSTTTETTTSNTMTTLTLTTTTMTTMTMTTTTTTMTISSTMTMTTITRTTVTDTTLTDTSTTTATTSATNAPPPATVAVQRVDALEDVVFLALIESNATSGTQKEDGLTLVARVLDVETVNDAGGSLTVDAEVDGGVASATVPASIFDQIEEEDGIILMLTAFDTSAAAALGNSEEEIERLAELPVQVKGAVNANLFTLTGHRLSVSGLVEPVKVILPVNYSDGMQCVFWDEERSTWSSQGVELLSSDGGYVVCESSHLTLFAAILSGFVNTFACSQVSLLNAESIMELSKGDWYKTPSAILLWGLCGTFLVMVSVAAYLDWNRWRQGRANDEHFLIPTEGMERLAYRRTTTRSARGAKTGGLYICLTCLGSWFCHWCRNSGAVRDAVDEVASTWASRFGEIRDFVEGLVEGLELWGVNSRGAGCCERFVAVINHLMCTTLAISARRQAAASLRISCDVSCLVMEDEDMFDVLLAHSTRVYEPGEWQVFNDVSAKVLAREENWGRLHREVEAKVDRFMVASARWSSLPCTVWRLFVHHTPFGACLVHCAFTSSKMRVLLFAVDIVGAIMLATIFFAASGLPGKRARNVGCDFDDPYQFFGRLLAIGTGSIVLSGVPAIVLGSLSTRGIRKFDREGSPEWERQLMVWRLQDGTVWLLGLGYLLFCAFFTALFLANVAQEDQLSWLISISISVVEDTIVIPLGVALTLPLLLRACLSFMSFHKGKKKEELIDERHMQIKREGNMTLPMLRI